MVQGEKQTSLLTLTRGNNGRTNDPGARKAGFESLKRVDNEKKDTKNSTHGSWGPVFQNKNNFAQMHFC